MHIIAKETLRKPDRSYLELSAEMEPAPSLCLAECCSLWAGMAMTEWIWAVCSGNVVSAACQCSLEAVSGSLAAPELARG